MKSRSETKMVPSAIAKTTPTPTSGKKPTFSSPLVIGVVAAIFVVFVASIIWCVLRQRQHVRASNKIRQEAVERLEAGSMLPK
ncbi:hypothetical protein B0T12DRAFT_469703 [Alternaria alternata]|nr:hypothetical protein B0T12DRAFT_469703 [Alternaria alternata]